MDEKAQTALEYLLILAGAILVVVAATLIIRGQIVGPVSKNVESNATAIKNSIRNVS